MDKLHFDDLTKIIAPFGLLDDDTQQRLRAWPHGVEFFTARGAWVVCGHPSFFGDGAYRARPAQLEPDYVDWSQVGPAVNYIATDEDGEVWGYEMEPMISTIGWQAQKRRAVRYADRLFPSYRPGAVGWRDSLISRPGVEG